MLNVTSAGMRSVSPATRMVNGAAVSMASASRRSFAANWAREYVRVRSRRLITSSDREASFASAHQPVTVGAADRLVLGEPGQAERREIRVARGSVGDERGHHRAHGGRQLEPVTGEAGGHVEALGADAVEDRVP